MKKTSTMIKRFVSLLVTFVMIISLVPSAFATPYDQFSDFPTGWSKPAMEAAVDNGLLVGIGDGQIGPQKYLTRAEMAAVMVRAFGATTYADVSRFTDLDPNSWYYNYVACAVQMGALSGVSGTEMAPNDYITREQVFSVLARILALSGNNDQVLSKFNDGSQVSAWARNTVIPMVERGYVNGDNFGNINPQAYITREEFAQLMYSTIKRYITTPGTYTEDMDGIVVIRCGNVTIKDSYVEGDLVIGDGAAKNFVNLEGVTINGRLLARGGNNNLKETTVNYGVVVLNPNGITPFRNYRTEIPFNGIIEYTVASFITNSGTTSGPSGETTKYTVTFKLFESDTDEYAEIKVSDGKKIGTKMPDDPDASDIPGFTFNGWVDENGDPVTADTRVNDDMLVVADLTPIGPTITVTFFEGYGQYAPEIDEVELTLNDFGEATVDVADIPDISNYEWLAYSKSDYMPSGYEDFDGEVYVAPEFFYYDGTEWLPFDETVVLTTNTTVHLMYKQVEVTGFDASVSTRYTSATRVIDSIISLSHFTTVQLVTAKNTGLSIYEKIDETFFGLLESKDLIDENGYVKKILIPLPINSALTESLIKDVIEERIEDIIDTPALYDKLFLWPEVEEYLIANGPTIPSGLTDDQIRTLIKNYIDGLTPSQKDDLVDDLCEVIYDTDEYDETVDVVINNKTLVVDEDNIKIVKEIHKELETITFDTVMGLSHDSFFDTIVDMAGYGTCEDIFDTGRERYCEDLAEVIEAVENGSVTSESIETEFSLYFDPIGDILAPIYEKAQVKAIDKLENADVRYDENPYLQYIVEHDVIDRLFIDTGVETEERTGYKLKDITDYSAYAVELEIAVNDALLWYGDELTETEFNAVLETVFEKAYSANDKIDEILEDFVVNGELPAKIQTAISSVQKVNDLYLKFEPKLKSIVEKYLNSSIHDEIVNGTLDENDRVQTAIDILIGHDDPVFTMDTLIDIFYQKDDKIQEKLQTLIDSGKFDTAINKLRNSSIGEKLGDDAIDDIVEIVENVAEYGVEYYEVGSSDITVIEKYEFTIGSKTFTVVRSFIF